MNVGSTKFYMTVNMKTLVITGFSWNLQLGQAFSPWNEPDDAMTLRPGKVGTIGCEGYSPGLTPRLLVKWSSGDQEFTNKLSLTW